MATKDKLIVLERKKVFIRALDEKQELIVADAVKEQQTEIKIVSATDNTKALLRDYGYGYAGNDIYKFLLNDDEVTTQKTPEQSAPTTSTSIFSWDVYFFALFFLCVYWALGLLK